jgi:hypothetical protein
LFADKLAGFAEEEGIAAGSSHSHWEEEDNDDEA